MKIDIADFKVNKEKSLVPIAIIFGLQIVIAYIISITDKNDNLFTHLMYLPVVFAAFLYDYKIGIFGGLIGGLMIEVFLPPQPGLSYLQQLNSGIIRTLFFIFASLIVGFFRNQYLPDTVGMENIALLDPFTKLPNWSAFVEDTYNKIKTRGIVNFRFVLIEISNQNELMASFGLDCIYQLNHEIVNKIKHKYKDSKLYLIRLNTLGLVLPLSHKNMADLISFLEEPIPMNGIPVYCEVTIGEASYPEGGYSPEEILKSSYLALNAAKRSQKPYQLYNTHLFNPEIPLLLGQFQNAITARDVDFHYQPIIDRDGNVNALEALVRWNHPVKGIIPPNEFIPDLEFTRITNFLTYYSLDLNLQRTSLLLEQGFDLKISLNISITNLFQTDFFEKVRKSIEKYHFPPDHLTLEVTERGFLSNDKDCQKNLNSLFNYGVNISIDDFGVGFTSISNFRNSGISAIKIDRSFIENIHQNKANQVIVSGLITIARSSGIMVIAEGIENELEKKKTLALGVDCLQGYLISKPVDFPSIQQWLHARH